MADRSKQRPRRLVRRAIGRWVVFGEAFDYTGTARTIYLERR